MVLVTSEQMQALDRRAMEVQRIPGLVLMELAGKAVAEVVWARRPRRVVVLCGKGNNGGDGWVAARWLAHLGVPQVRVLTLADPADLRGDAAQAARIAMASGIAYEVWQPGVRLPDADVYVDGLLGTGASRPLAGDLAALVEAVNACSPWTVAIDVPSGIDASTGEVRGTAVRAQVTVCMAAQKLGTAVWPGCEYAGEVRVADIGISVPDAPEYARLTTPAWVARVLPPRTPASHKGTFGKVGIAVGEMAGAALLAGTGAARSGAGYVVLGVPGERLVAPYEFIQRPLCADHPHTLADVLADCQALVLGPGWGRRTADWAVVVNRAPQPAVIDADALPLWQPAAGAGAGPRVLTPHPKECARLLGWPMADVQARRLAAAQTLARAAQAVVVLKGYRTIVAAPDGRIRVNPTGDASLATAGSGDVLAGVIGGLLAQGLDPFDAAAAGVYLHGLAGELAGRRLTMAATMASDVVQHLPQAIAAVCQQPPGE
ncbi:bifunctional NAD(P)H-hydrate repair enzyme Nnr [Alicyclobacillus cellulosilyticus]|uniref:Bifunctional NAD(P)H-hydrate repair enzyme n=1 Tax=Alicyclobacillus cellulosilyticus TaxID=1003997 RepID=A0A917K9E2_9BACL|nr:NAD(P)H-hydrate dehydratase [Alicyclobacillus cellulosilyticus]GGJ03999.1 bifunctional NAD(P)H-hydrate repair enzyme Nnr [Alicyclobacillus cellulosilyticus]